MPVLCQGTGDNKVTYVLYHDTQKKQSVGWILSTDNSSAEFLTISGNHGSTGLQMGLASAKLLLSVKGLKNHIKTNKTVKKKHTKR